MLFVLFPCLYRVDTIHSANIINNHKEKETTEAKIYNLYEIFIYFQQIQIWMKEAESTKGLLATKDIDSSQRASDEQCILQ